MALAKVITTANGDRISWNAYDIGLTVNGSDNNDTASDLKTDRIPTFRGIIFLSTNSEDLSFMNNVVGLYVNDEKEDKFGNGRTVNNPHLAISFSSKITNMSIAFQ